ncbi:DUF6913 domain-containing protein [Maribacter cobaltidurans]|uniref:Uncharacterized protein n=1 Tax=Maribacter cobaltidurans TaxID=1178778 RepID=A0A223V9B2_9FLAO|nr:hypothetical protein [Maribacter cobaltidurans]ASV31983.1 hypothetical protein CJ263_18150 [Maribacter cobaltidurans]GGD86217.1 hypothetical protein GCM10011412_25040 [Maribacter cobaltidurans]
MFLKGIKDKFKQKSGLKYIKQELEKPVNKSTGKKGIRSLGCIVDLDKFDKSDLFYQFLDDFSLRPNAVKIIGYKSFYDKNSPYSTPIFSDKDLGWNGDIQNSYALEFLSREYDLLVNYYDENNLLLNLMSIKTRARMKVGFGTVGPDFNDLILETPISDFKTFKAELKKYLGVFKEI